MLLPRWDLVQFLQLVQGYRVTRAYLVPPMVLALAKQPIVDQFDLSTLKTIGCAAAPLSQEVARACSDRLGCRIKQLYGMTEVGITHIAPDDLDWSKLGTVGLCVPHSACKIVDPVTGAELGPDQQGEIWIRGPVHMKGYLNRPEATAQLIDAEGWAHTGDVGFVDVDGYLTVVDRLKELIKYKGLQVAPAELEAVLLTTRRWQTPPSSQLRRRRRRSAEGVRRPQERSNGRGADGVRRRTGGAVQEGAPAGVRRPNPEVSVRQDPAPGAGRARARRPVESGLRGNVHDRDGGCV